MKKICILLFLIVSIQLSAQEKYFPEGTWWEEIYKLRHEQYDVSSGLTRWEVKGDSILNGKKYKKVYRHKKEDFIFLIREEADKVYLYKDLTPYFNENSPYPEEIPPYADLLIYDFDWESQDLLYRDYLRFDEEKVKYYIEHSPYLNCSQARKVVFQDGNEYDLIGEYENWEKRRTCNVRTIGSLSSIFQYALQDWNFAISGRDYELISFHRNGVHVYQHPDFPNGIVDAIGKAPLGDNGKSSVIFDISGRRLNAIPQKGFYIENGKKKVR